MSAAKNELHYAQVIVDLPGVEPLDYTADQAVAANVRIGVRCVVPLGRSARVGIVVELRHTPAIEPHKIKPITRVLDEIAPLSVHWLQLTRFVAEYYQHAWGEVALPALPRALRTVPGPRYSQSIARLRERAQARWAESGMTQVEHTTQQAVAIDALSSTSGFAPHWLFGGVVHSCLQCPSQWSLRDHQVAISAIGRLTWKSCQKRRQ